MAYLADRRTAGDPLPAALVRSVIGGISFTAGRRTAAHLEWTIQQLKDRYPTCALRVIQGCYNVGVAASAGTHDKDGCIDVEIVGVAWLDAQRFLRESGWAAWWRYPPTFGNHIHMVSLGCPGPVGVYVPGQVDDYYAHRTGLAGHVADDTWHPADIDSTVFDYPAYLEEQPEMNADDKKWMSDLIDAKLAANNTTLVKAVWNAAIDKSGTVAKAALRKAMGA